MERAWLRRNGDTLLAVVLAAAFAVELVLRGQQPALSVPCGVLASLALALRRRLPLPSFLLVWVALLALGRFEPHWDDNSMVFLLVFFIALYSLGAHSTGLEFRLSVLVVVVGIVLFVLSDGDPFYLGDIVFAAVIVGGPWAAGVAIRLRRDREAALTEENERAVAEERARIARELHDVVSHAIAVTVLQARGGRRLVGVDEDEVRRALDAIEQTNTQALGDMRRLLSLLRDAETGEPRGAPQPSLAGLNALVDQVRTSGVDVDLEVSGEPVAMPPGVELSAYRIVQEALTNVVKHAGPGTLARVEVRYGEDLEVRVRDNGTAPVTTGGGHGLMGIHERVAVAGGAVHAGPLPTGGFEVHARLPYGVET